MVRTLSCLTTRALIPIVEPIDGIRGILRTQSMIIRKESLEEPTVSIRPTNAMSNITRIIKRKAELATTCCSQIGYQIHLLIIILGEETEIVSLTPTNIPDMAVSTKRSPPIS